MAAIAPHLEKYESTEEELEYASCSLPYGIALSGLEGGRRCPSPQAIVSAEHANLVRMAMTRQAIADELARSGVSFRAQFGTSDGRDKNELYIVLGRNDVPGASIGSRGPEWNSHLETLGAGGGFKVLSWTTKMDAPSFSLPAGGPEVDGSCPGAVAGQTTSRDNKNFVSLANLIRKHVPKYEAEPGSAKWFADAICQSCYAERGNYSYSSKQLASALIYLWVKNAVVTGEFVRMMVPAIDMAKYVKNDRVTVVNGYEVRRYFRIHDSGDMFHPNYLRAWREIADHFVPGNKHGYEPVLFWAPTRIWTLSWGQKAIEEIVSGSPNLVVRPSSYHINTPAFFQGEIAGAAAGSTVTAKSLIDSAMAAGAFDWNCPAYDSKNEKHSCTSARGPDGAPKCRACWSMPSLRINYKHH